jgi:hypothetical protein
LPPQVFTITHVPQCEGEEIDLFLQVLQKGSLDYRIHLTFFLDQ